MSSSGWEQLIEAYTNMYDDIRWAWRVLEERESVCERVKERGRERKKIGTEGQLLAVFECGRILTCVLQRGRCMYENVRPPPQAR